MKKRVVAIQNRLNDIERALSQWVTGIEDIHNLLEVTDSKILQKILLSIARDYEKHADTIRSFQRNMNGEDPDEIIEVTQIFNSISRSGRKLDGLMSSVEKVFRTSSLDDASMFWLIQTQIQMLQRELVFIEDKHKAIMIYYADDGGGNIQQLEQEYSEKRDQLLLPR